MPTVSADERRSHSALRLTPAEGARLLSVTPQAETYPGTLPATWLAQRAAVDPAKIDALRRAGELIAVREPGSIEWRYPAWQFENGKPRQAMVRLSRSQCRAPLQWMAMQSLVSSATICLVA